MCSYIFIFLFSSVCQTAGKSDLTTQRGLYIIISALSTIYVHSYIATLIILSQIKTVI